MAEFARKKITRRALMAGLAILPLSATAEAKVTEVELHVSSDGDFLSFQPEELTCPAGAHVRLIFHHAGERIIQQHNWMLVMPGTADEMIEAALQAGEKRGWVPAGDKRIIAVTPLCAPGATVMVEFTAPPPGDYPFISSFAGQGEEMRGVLHVTA